MKCEIEVIPNFVDLNRFSRLNKEHFRKAIAPNGEKILIHTSNFRKVKRVEDVVKVFERVVNKTPAKLLLVGDGPERPHIEALCRELGTCDHIRFLGKQEAVEELLALADVFLLPSETESFGLAALEAMACEVPVVSSNIGGLPEVNIDGKTGYLCNVGDTDSIRGVVTQILENLGPIAVLVNNYSASASEVLSACLQDNKRAVIIGERTWGKGSVQNVIQMEKGDSALKLTTASYHRPSGVNIHRFPKMQKSDEWGVTPDKGYEVSFSRDQWQAWDADRDRRDVLRADGEKKPESDVDEPFDDVYLSRALDYIKEQLGTQTP